MLSVKQGGKPTAELMKPSKDPDDDGASVWNLGSVISGINIVYNFVFFLWI